jgi:hypothetical protein
MDTCTFIYSLESMLAPWNGITEGRINMDENQPFNEQELVLAFIDAAGLLPATTSLYTPVTRREFAGGCATFSLKDALYFLRDRTFTEKCLITNASSVTLPKSKIPLQTIQAMRAECMQLTQSLSTIIAYQRHIKRKQISPLDPITIH